jgi:hypothetical protein
MWKSIVLLWLLLMPFSPVSDPAQANKDTVPTGAIDEIRIGGANLRLGMPKEEALSDLGRYYALQIPRGTVGDSWIILDKTHSETLVGNVEFRAGKLHSAIKFWTDTNKDYSGPEAAEIVYKVFSELVSRGNRNCKVSTSTTLPPSGPGHLESRETDFTCGHRQVAVILSWQSSSGYIQINESLSAEPYWNAQ